MTYVLLVKVCRQDLAAAATARAGGVDTAPVDVHGLIPAAAAAARGRGQRGGRGKGERHTQNDPVELR